MRETVRVLFMGTPEFAKASLESIYESGFNVVGVFTNPDKPSGRGMKLTMSEVKEYALSKDLEIFQPVKLRNDPQVIETINNLKPDVIVVVAYGKILPKEILELPKYGCINVHGSLLPKYRGAAPIQWSIINGEKTTGITTMFMDEGMDTGDMLLKKEINIDEEDNYETLYNKLKDVGAKLIIETLDKVLNNNINRVKQIGGFSLAPMINKEMTKIDFSKTALDIHNLVRGLSPSPATYMETEDGRRFKVYDTEVIYETSINEPGIVSLLSKNELHITCGENKLSIITIQPPNSKKMDIKAFLAGNALKENQKFI